MKARKWCVIADDFTGAGDSAIKFGGQGRAARLIADPRSSRRFARGAAALVMNTDSRFDSAQEAYGKVFRAAEALRARGFRDLYKKVDSTLRGNVAAEIAAVMEAASYRFAVLAASAPRNMRTVTGGLCMVDGIPIGAEGTARDPFNPVEDARIARILEPSFPGAVGELPLGLVRSGPDGLRAAAESAVARGARILVADAQTMRDLEAIASLVSMRGILFAGSSGLAEALSGRSGVFRGDAELPSIPRGKALFVIGSLSLTSKIQCESLIREGGATELVVDAAAALADPKSELYRLLELGRAAPRAEALLVRTSGMDARGPGCQAGREAASGVSSFLGALGPALLRARGAKFIFASGGDTASRIVLGLGARRVDFESELLPGVAFGRIDLGWPRRRLRFASKSGGFGPPAALSEALSLVCSGRSAETKEHVE